MSEQDQTIIGRARIAHELGRSERTVTRWITRGVLPAAKAGPFSNNLLEVRRADLEQLKRRDRPKAVDGADMQHAKPSLWI
jgi:hypothetical protein